MEPKMDSVSCDSVKNGPTFSNEGFSPHRDFLQAKAAVHVLLLVGFMALAHYMKPYGEYAVWGFSVVSAAYLARLFFYVPPDAKASSPEPLPSWRNMSSIELSVRGTSNTLWPIIHIIVPARNEEAVLPKLLESLENVDYPTTRLHVYLVNDQSTDNTGQIMLDYMQQNKNTGLLLTLLQVSQVAGSDQFKAGALNAALEHISQRQRIRPTTENNDLVLVLNADSVLPVDSLRQAVPYLQREEMAAVQFRKIYVNAQYNSWTKSQAAEIAFDTLLQVQRSNYVGLGELRGNGYMVKREILLQKKPSCDDEQSNFVVGFCVDTLTEDLDLTCRIQCMHEQQVCQAAVAPVVEEEAVIYPTALWRQRCRWAAGGFQRHLEYYWPVLFSKRPGVLTFYQWIDTLLIGFVQYALPLLSIADTGFSIVMGRFLPILFPFQCVVTLFGAMFMMKGIKQQQGNVSLCSLLMQTFFGLLFMGNWFLVIIYMTLRMAFCPMRRRWIKTQHGDWCKDTATTTTTTTQHTVPQFVNKNEDSGLNSGSTENDSSLGSPLSGEDETLV